MCCGDASGGRGFVTPPAHDVAMFDGRKSGSGWTSVEDESPCWATVVTGAAPSNPELEEAVVAAFVASQRARLELCRAVARWDRTLGGMIDGLGPVSWLAYRLRIGRGDARTLLGLARSLARYTALDQAVEAGVITLEVAGVIAAQFTRPRMALADRDVDMLIAQAAELPVRTLYTVMRYWAAATDDALAPDRPGDDAFVAGDGYPGSARLSKDADGVGVLSATLVPDATETVRAALELAMALDRGPTRADSDDESPDRRSVEVRRAAALLLLARFFLEHHDDTAIVSGQRPNINITIDWDRLASGRPGYGHVTDEPEVLIDRNIVDRLCCDASIARIITKGKGLVINAGRTTRVVSRAQRVAVVQRDRYCRFHGCHKPARFGEIHHIRPWAAGGPTDLNNLALLCWTHQHLIHAGWKLTGNPNSTLTFTAPNGMVYQSRPPPITTKRE